MTLGEKIKKSRTERGMSQEQLAEELIVSRAAVAKWETDKGMPDIENLKKISQVFHISIDELLENTVQGKSRETDVGADTFYVNYIGKKCTVQMTDWNDGILESYLLNQDEIFLYYAIVEKKKTKVGALAKQYIERITECIEKKKQKGNLADFTEVNRKVFCK